jgi:septum site-determining protein MinD
MSKTKIISVSSGKGGVGKTTVTANLGSALAFKGKKTLVIDFDIGQRNLDLLLGLENRIVYTIADVLDKKASFKKAMIFSKYDKKLSFIAASQNETAEVLNFEKVKDFLEEIVNSKESEQFDYIIIDSPAGVEHGFQAAISRADFNIVVVNPEISSLRDSDKAIGLIDASTKAEELGGQARKGLVVNRIDKKMVKEEQQLNLLDIKDVTEVDILGVVPMEPSLIESSNIGKPVFYDDSKAVAASFNDLADSVIEDFRIYNEEELINFFDSKFLNWNVFKWIGNIASSGKKIRN